MVAALVHDQAFPAPSGALVIVVPPVLLSVVGPSARRIVFVSPASRPSFIPLAFQIVIEFF